MKVKIINDSKFELPKYQTKGSVGMDLRFDFDGDIVTSTGFIGRHIENFGKEIKKIGIQPKTRCILPTKIKIQLPKGYEAQIRPRSGISFKTWIDVKLGTIDSDYIGYIGIIVWNVSNETITIEDGERIAQIIVTKTEKVEWEQVDKLEETIRGDCGFGHTGKK